MDQRRIRHSRMLATLIVLGVIIAGLRVCGVDEISLRIAWHRMRLLSDNPQVGVAQVEALAALGDRGTPHLIWCVTHDVDAVQLAAIKVLRERKVTRASPALIRALDDGNAAVRQAANDALEAISGKNFGYNAYNAWANRRNEVREWQDWWATQRFEDGPRDRTALDGPAGN